MLETVSLVLFIFYLVLIFIFAFAFLLSDSFKMFFLNKLDKISHINVGTIVILIFLEILVMLISFPTSVFCLFLGYLFKNDFWIAFLIGFFVQN